MSPNIYEWQGIILRFHSNDHLPVHVHAVYAEFESIYEFEVHNGKVINIEEREVPGANPLPERQHKQALSLIKKYKGEILIQWVNFFTLRKKVKVKRIRGNRL